MLSWLSPWWLIGLALLPLIRWLHRGGRQRRALRVSHLPLWQGAAASPQAAGQRLPPDPAWRRRALLAALLFVVLAGPLLPQRQPVVTLWIDDSLSMLTREPQGDAAPTRLVIGLALARRQLDEFAQAGVTVRALSDPWRDRGALDEALAAALVAGAGKAEPAAPPAALLRADQQHWLVTDGSRPALLTWPGDRQPDRLVRVGSVTRNVGVQRLSARRHADDGKRIDVLVELVNGGTAVESRELVLTGDAGELGRWTQQLQPGASAWVGTTLPHSTTLRAALQPGDALPEDDALELDSAALRKRRVAVDAACPQALHAALRAHPALQTVAAAADAEAALDCSASAAAAAARPTLRVRADRLPWRPGGVLSWSDSIAEWRRVRLDDAPWAAASLLPTHAGDVVLLAAGDDALIVERAGPPRTIETSLAFGSSGTATPLLANLMFEQLFGSPLLDAVALVERGAAASRVAPSAQPEPAVAAATPPARQQDPARLLLVLALLLLCWEVIALVRQAWRLRTRAA